jgi:hypothetical protein
VEAPGGESIDVRNEVDARHCAGADSRGFVNEMRVLLRPDFFVKGIFENEDAPIVVDVEVEM